MSRELDAWLAENLFGWTRGKAYIRPGHEWIRDSEKEEHDLLTSPDGNIRIFMCCDPGRDYGESWGNGGRWGDSVGEGFDTSLPDYSTTWDGMGAVIDAMRDKGYRCYMDSDLGLSRGARCRFSNTSLGSGVGVADARADDLRLAVSLAARRLLEQKVETKKEVS